MHKGAKAKLRIRYEIMVLVVAKGTGTVLEVCREFEIPRSPFYNWKNNYDQDRRSGIVKKTYCEK
jgi:DNA invertase Pin-like site-specific DNA recombinase